MSESEPKRYFYNFSPTRSERASVYIGDSMNEEDRESAESLAGSYLEAKPMENTAILIPVAAHQDADYIVPTMEQYAGQRNCDPFTIFLHLNSPMEAHEETVEAAFDKVKEARARFPNLDIRFGGGGYSEGQTIGLLRRHLWDAAFMVAYADRKFDDGHEVIGMNHDIDTVSISPHYVSRVQRYYARRETRAWAVGTRDAIMKPIGTRVSHAVLPSHPNVGKVTRWIDNSYFQSHDHGSYEAGLVIPFSHYASVGGFDDKAVTHETHRFAIDGRYRHIVGAQLFTSPRRYIDRVLQHGSKKIWTDDSFGAEDACRDILRPDISLEQAEDIILDRLHSDIENFWLLDHNAQLFNDINTASLSELRNPGYKALIKRCMEISFSKQLTKAERLLRLVVGSDILADMVRGSFDPSDIAEQQTNTFIDLNIAWLLEEDKADAKVDNRGANL